jgi:hypothetical protein
LSVEKNDHAVFLGGAHDEGLHAGRGRAERVLLVLDDGREQTSEFLISRAHRDPVERSRRDPLAGVGLLAVAPVLADRGNRAKRPIAARMVHSGGDERDARTVEAAAEAGPDPDIRAHLSRTASSKHSRNPSIAAVSDPVSTASIRSRRL